MKILLTGACGFVGSCLARALLELRDDYQITGVENFIRPGSETNRDQLRRLGVQLIHGDLRSASDVDALPAADWVIDAAANPSVLAGIDGRSSSRQVVEHNLLGTVNALEYCRRHGAGFVLLSTSRVYSVAALAALPMEKTEHRFRLPENLPPIPGLSEHGIAEDFSIAAPISLYGATKLASEVLALEYAETLDLPVWVNRCGVMAGAGQFGRADQGIIAYWINAYLRRQPLRYIGFGGSGRQVRDVLHPRDVATLLHQQLEFRATAGRPRVVNLGGGTETSFSLVELTDWCRQRFGFEHAVASDPKPRPLDLPWVVMDSRLAGRSWNWTPATRLTDIFEEVAAHAQAHPNWLQMSAPLS